MPKHINGTQCHSHTEVAELLDITPTQAMHMGMMGRLEKGPRAGYVTTDSLVNHVEAEQLKVNLGRRDSDKPADPETERRADLDRRTRAALAKLEAGTD